jgi:uncharacterized protein
MSDSHESDVLAERERRAARLRSDRGWFALVDRVWLEEGDNETPLGTMTARDGALTLRVGDGRAVLRDGRPAVDGPVQVGDTFEHGGKRYDVGQGGTRWSLRVWDPDAPARAAFQSLAYYPIRPEWRVVARFIPLDPPRILAMPFSSGDVGDRESPGVLSLEVGGQALQLFPVIETDPRPRLFILFADATNRDETYGAGRLLYAPMPVDGATVLDFNKAMNPACAFNELVVCPLPPRDNRVALRIEAGEKKYDKP